MLFIIIGAISLVIIFLVFRVFSNREKQLIKKLYELEKAGKLSEAILTARQLLDTHPNFAAYHWRLAKLYEKNNTPGSALKIYEIMKERSLVSQTVRMETVLESMVTLLLKNKEYGRAFTECLALMKYNPKNITGLITLARIYASQGKNEAALNSIQDAIKNSPANPEAHLYYALMLFDSGELRPGLAELELSLKEDPHNANTLYFMAAATRQTGYPDKAKDIIERLKIDAGKIPTNILNLGILKQHMPKLDLDELKKTTGKKDGNSAAILTMDAFMTAPPEVFHETVRAILSRMKFTITQQIQDGSVDPKNVAAMIGDNQGMQNYIEFHRTEAETGLITFSEFFQRMEQRGIPSGLFITTSRLATTARKLISQAGNEVTVMERDALKRFLR